MAASTIEKKLLLTTGSFSGSATVAANTEATIAITITPPTGYTAVGVLDFNVDNRSFIVAGARLSASTTVQIRGKNTTSSSVTVTGTVTVLFTN